MTVKPSATSFVFSRIKVTGRDKDAEEIIEMLMRSSDRDNVSIIAIVGIGGLGKTTLAQIVYNDEEVAEFFKKRMWICVSENFDLKLIVEKTLRSITNKELGGNLDLDQLQIFLRENFAGKRYLLVLDDVWDESSKRWASLNALVSVGGKGSKILVTTRSSRVASVVGVENPYMLKGLTKHESWDLFEQLAFGKGKEGINPSLINIGKEMVKKCKGVPLAVKTLASLLQFKSKESEWLFIQDSEIWAMAQDENDILPVLKLSYDHLPIHLRQCFAYCSVLPKGCEIDKRKLMQLWMAQGYIQSPRGSEYLEDIGNQYFMNLLSRSLFEVVGKDDHDNVASCQMHDLIHDLACSIAGNSCSVFQETDGKDIHERTHHVSFEVPQLLSTENLGYLQKASGLRTILLPKICELSDKFVEDEIISKFKRLRALDLHASDIKKLSSSIDKLKHLRYLDLSDNDEMEILPNSVILYNLQTLILSNCGSLQELPLGMGNLINLKFLMIDGCANLSGSPIALGQLTSLCILPRFIAGRDSRSATGNALNGLNHLRGEMKFEGLENVKNAAVESNEVNLKQKNHIQSLLLRWGFNGENQNSMILLDNMEPHPNLKELRVKGYPGVRFSSWLSSITTLVQLNLYNCGRCQYLPPLDQLPSLNTISLHRLPALEYISRSCSAQLCSSAFFPCLKQLKLLSCPKLKDFAVGTLPMAELPEFPSLSKLWIVDCPGLSLMPLYPSLQGELFLLSTSAKPLQQTMQMKSSSTSSSSLSLPLSKITSLYIGAMVDFESLPEEGLRNLTSLESMSVHSCPKLMSLPGNGFRGLTSLRSLRIQDNERLRSLHGVFQHLTALNRLEILGCEELDFLDDMRWQGLQSLTSLSISQLPQLVW